MSIEMKEGLLAEKSTNTSSSSYYIDRYNEVISFHNKHSPILLDSLDSRDDFRKVHNFIKHVRVKILLVLVLLFIPLVNLISLGFLFFYYLFLRKQGKIHKQNMKKIKDPLAGYRFMSDLYEQLGNHSVVVNVNPNEQGFTFNQQLFSEHTVDGQTVKVVLYDQYFYDSFHLVRTEQIKVGGWLALGALLITVNIVLLLELFQLI